MAVAAARLLPHFGGGFDDAQPMAPVAGFRSLAEKATSAPAATASPMQDSTLVERAVAAAVEEARQDFELQRAADREEHERALAARATEIHAALADTLSEQLKVAVADINSALSAQVARVLLRFLEKSVRERAVGELAETVSALLLGRDAVRVRVSGPADLVDRLGAAVGAVAAVEVEVSEAADVTVVIDNTTIETQIGAWMERTAGAVAGGGDG